MLRSGHPAAQVLRLRCTVHDGTSWRIGVDTSERTELVTLVIRNPIFTALLLIQIGTAVMAPTWMAVLGVVALLLGCQGQVRLVEEPYLFTMHQVSYPSYARQAGRFLPMLGRLRHTRPTPTNPRAQREAGKTGPSDGQLGSAGIEQ